MKSAVRDIRPWGYYTDARGYKQFGEIPDKPTEVEEQYRRLGLNPPDDPFFVAEVSEYDPVKWVDPKEDNILNPIKELTFELV